jgi:hypothetical protein
MEMERFTHTLTGVGDTIPGANCEMRITGHKEEKRGRPKQIARDSILPCTDNV